MLLVVWCCHLAAVGWRCVYVAYDLCRAVDQASVDAALTIHSGKAHLVSSLTLSTTCLADSIIQLAVAKGQRHEVLVKF